MGRRRPEEEHGNHEAWAIPYGDLLTLLLAFFVVMYAVSSVNEGKYRILSDSLQAAFRGAPRSMEPIQVGELQRGSGADIQMTLVRERMMQGQPRNMLELGPRQLRDELTQAFGTRSPAGDGVADELQQITDSVQASVTSLVADGLVAVSKHKTYVEVEIKADILFASGSAALSAPAIDVIARLADVLRDYPNAVRVEGHTDNVPINNAAYRSNWELSAARAASVVQVLERHGVAPARLSVLGQAEYRPKASNETPEGRNANRRVLVLILGGSGGRGDLVAAAQAP
ncbi:MAG: flagellar motor protein MotD [Steroidobacteraceae bacterium]|nr:flagellar motor protein MotD [Steroidobacteraceae bacterium]MDW8258382.1 flagellar motor protein MotD [Gammaproteobacteria bacterium]